MDWFLYDNDLRLLKVLDKNIDHINLFSAAGLPLVYGIVAVTMMRYNNNSIIRY